MDAGQSREAGVWFQVLGETEAQRRSVASTVGPLSAVKGLVQRDPKLSEALGLEFVARVRFRGVLYEVRAERGLPKVATAIGASGDFGPSVADVLVRAQLEVDRYRTRLEELRTAVQEAIPLCEGSDNYADGVAELRRALLRSAGP